MKSTTIFATIAAFLSTASAGPIAKPTPEGAYRLRIDAPNFAGLDGKYLAVNQKSSNGDVGVWAGAQPLSFTTKAGASAGTFSMFVGGSSQIGLGNGDNLRPLRNGAAAQWSMSKYPPKSPGSLCGKGVLRENDIWLANPQAAASSQHNQWIALPTGDHDEWSVNLWNGEGFLATIYQPIEVVWEPVCAQ